MEESEESIPSEKAPVVAAILVSWNSLGYLPASLRSLSEQTLPPDDIVLVDNGSTDGSQAWVRENYPAVRLFENGRNLGFCRANNQGISLANAEYILLVNTDVVLEPDFVRTLVEAMRSDSGLGSASGKLLCGSPQEDEDEDGDGVRTIDSAGEVIYNTRRCVNRGEGEVDSGRYDAREEVFGVTAAAALYRASMLEDVRIGEDYFDVDYFAYMEDSDLNWRAQLRGWRCLYEPAAVGYHVRQHATSRNLSIRRHAAVNRYLTLWKNETLANLLLGLPSLVPYEGFRALKLLFREPELLPGFAKLVRLLPRTLRKRHLIQSRRRVSSGYIRSWTIPEDYRGEFRRRLRKRPQVTEDAVSAGVR